MIIHKINVYNRDIIVVENDDGTFNKPDILSEFEGIGSALKPALEPITVARKPLDEKTVAENCLKWGVGGINIDACRVESSQDDKDMLEAKSSKNPTGVKSGFGGGIASKPDPLGRFPANLIHDGSDEVVELFPNSKSPAKRQTNSWFPSGDANGIDGEAEGYGDSGSASRFFYCAKSSRSERTNKGTITNGHPTIKPIALMEYLVKLVSREGALVLDPFAGSGSTLLACKNLGRGYAGIEMDEEYIKIINARLGNTL